MTREEFDRILKEEGITRQALPDDLWRTSPVAHEALEEKRLRKASRPGRFRSPLSIAIFSPLLRKHLRLALHDMRVGQEGIRDKRTQEALWKD